MTRVLLTVSLVFLGCGGTNMKADSGAGGGEAAADGDDLDRGPAGGAGGASGGGGGDGGGAGSGDEDGPTATGGVDGSVDGETADTGAGGIPGVGCPTTFPEDGNCSPPGLLCSYGTAPRPECRDRAACTGGVWTLMPAQCFITETNCPATAPAQSGVVVCPGAMVGLTCEYPDDGNGAECRCVGNPVTTGYLVCNRPKAPPEPCPAKLPNAGTSCPSDLQGMNCTYCRAGALWTFGEIATCKTDGTWAWTQTSCTQ